MKTLIMSSTLTVYDIDENGNEFARIIDNDNGFLDNLKKHMTSRKCMVIISGSPKKIRNEDPKEIINDILKGVGNADNYIVIEDRRTAVEFAIKNAIAGDIILLVGKGHEQYEIDKDGLHPFSEIEIAEKAAKLRKV